MMTRNLTLLALSAALWAAACAPTPPSERHPYRKAPAGCPENPTFDVLASGLYWIGPGGAECMETGASNPHFVPGQPTVVLFHGWKYGKTKSGDPLTLHDDRFATASPHLADAWLEAGWNVGIYRWTQHADETFPADAEAKIWDPRVSPNMRWWRIGHGWDRDDERGSIGDRAFSLLTRALSRTDTGELRLVGHSLGSQVATQTAARLHRASTQGLVPGARSPNRLVLLDPYWSSSSREGLTPSPLGDHMLGELEELAEDDVAIEVHTSSLFNAFTMDPKHGARTLGAWLDYHPDYITHLVQAWRHDALVWHYFATFSSGPLFTCDSKEPVPSSAASDDVIKAWMRRAEGARQRDGKPTSDPKDDCYEVHTP